MVVGDKVSIDRCGENGWVGIIWKIQWDGTPEDKPWKIFVVKDDGEVNWHYFYTHELKVLGHCGELVEGDHQHPLHQLMSAYYESPELVSMRISEYNQQVGQGLEDF